MGSSPSSPSHAHDASVPVARTLSWGGLVALLLLFALTAPLLAVIRLDSAYAYPDQASATTLVLNKSVGVLIVVAAITYLRWWPPVMHESLRTRRWVWLVPATFLVLAVAFTDYGRLVAAGPILTLSLVAGALLIAGGEELMFRGVVLTFARARFREPVAAIVTTALFGLMHAPAGVLWIVMTMIFGYLLYLTRRVSGGLIVPILVHASWDFAVFSVHTTATPDPDSSTGAILSAASIVLLIVVVALRGRVAPARAIGDPSAAMAADSVRP